MCRFIICFIFISGACVYTNQTENEQEEDHKLYSGAYHLKGLQDDVKRIKNTYLSSDYFSLHRQRRSADFQADELVLNSLSSYCSVFKSDPDIQRYFKKKTERLPLNLIDVSGFTSYTPDRNTQRDTPDVHEMEVIPIKVTAQRLGDIVWLVFDVAHSANVVTARISPFDFDSTYLKKEENTCSKIVSKTRFPVYAKNEVCKSRVKDRTKTARQVTFQFTTDRNDKLDHGIDTNIFVDVEVCNFDKTWEYLGYSTYIWKKPEKRYIASEKMKFKPKFRFSSSANVIYSDFDPYNGKNSRMTYDLEFDYLSGNTFSVSVMLWKENLPEDLNYVFNNTSKDEYHWVNIDRKESDYGQAKLLVTHAGCLVPNTCERSDIFTVEVQNISRSNNPDRRRYEWQFIWKVRVILGKLARNRRGRLSVGVEIVKHPPHRKNHIVTRARIERSVPIRPQYSSMKRYLTKAYLYPQGDMFCVNASMNCTVICEGIGPDVQTIYVTKNPPIEGHFLSTSYRLPSKTVAILDITKSRLFNAGNLTCVLVDTKGQMKTSSVNVHLHSGPSIKFAYQESGPNSDFLKVKVNLTGYGQYFNVSFYGVKFKSNFSLVYTSELINGTLKTDPDQNITSNVIRTKGKKNDYQISALLPWTKLRLPIRSLHAAVKGDLGSDKAEIMVDSYEQNFVGASPNIDPESLRVTVMKNGTSVITCNSTGLEPLRLNVYGIDFLNPSITTTRHGSVSSFIATSNDTDSGSIRRSLEMRLISCSANNPYNGRYETFKLDYFVDVKSNITL